MTSLPGQFVDIHSPDKLSDHDIVSGTLKIAIPPIKKPRRKVYHYQKGDYESMRAETLKFAKERYFNGYSDTRSVQENFNLNTSFIQESADKHIPSKTSRSVSSVPWITPEIRRTIRRKNATHAKVKKTGSAKFRSKFESLRKEIKADIRKQHDLYANNLVGDVKANPRNFYRCINSQKKYTQGIPPLKKRNGSGIAQSEFEKAEQFNGQFSDVFTKSEYKQVPLMDRSAPFMHDIVVTKEGVAKLLQQGYRYHKLRKTFSKFYRRHYELISKYNVGLKTLLSEGLSEPEFYGDLVYKLKKLKGINDFSLQFGTIISRYRRIGYNLNVMRQSACLVFNPIMVDNYAAFFNCTPVGRASDSMMAPT